LHALYGKAQEEVSFGTPLLLSEHLGVFKWLTECEEKYGHYSRPVSSKEKMRRACSAKYAPLGSMRSVKGKLRIHINNCRNTKECIGTVKVAIEVWLMCSKHSSYYTNR